MFPRDSNRKNKAVPADPAFQVFHTPSFFPLIFHTKYLNSDFQQSSCGVHVSV